MTARSSDSSLSSVQLQNHLKAMRRTVSAFGGMVVALAVTTFFLPRLGNELVSPTGATLIGAASALWIGFSANRDAKARMDRIRRAFAVHGELDRLLRDHHRAYLAVLLRLLVVAGCGIVVAVWGAGAGLGLTFFILAGILMAMSWPTEHKTRLLIRRAEALRPEERSTPNVQRPTSKSAPKD